MTLDVLTGKRKFIAWGVPTVLGFIAGCWGWMTGEQFVDLAKWLTGLYMVGNVGKAVSDKIEFTAKVKSDGQP
jgi:hypothetical protein